MNRSLQGIYAPYIREYIALKKSLGFKYETESTILALFDRFTIIRKEKNICPDRELAEAWRDLNPNESESYKYHRCVCFNQLCSYLSNLGIDAFIMQLPPFKSNFTPYIFSAAEINRLFSACDMLRSQRKTMNSAIMTFPALFRLLYATGLRIGEALSLKQDDVNMDDRYVIVRDSKNGKERMIPISTSLSDVLQQYSLHKKRLPLTGEASTNFFITLAGQGCGIDHVRKWFLKLLSAASITRSDTGPRVHDLRHTFSVHALAMMAESGVDLYCALPILSAYLGHQSLEATNVYVRLTAAMYPSLLNEVDLICLNVFPKLSNHATY